MARNKSFLYSLAVSGGFILLILGLWLIRHYDAVASTEIDITGITDKTEDRLSLAPISVKYLIEHRTFLNGASVRIEAAVVDLQLSQGKVIMADSKKSNRNMAYDLTVAVGVGAKAGDYFPGQRIVLRGIVHGATDDVYLELKNLVY